MKNSFVDFIKILLFVLLQLDFHLGDGRPIQNLSSGFLSRNESKEVCAERFGVRTFVQNEGLRFINRSPS